MLTKCAEVGDDDEKTRADERDQDGVEREGPDFIGVEREAAGKVDGGSEGCDEGERGQGSVGGDGNVSKLKEAGMHCRGVRRGRRRDEL